VPYNVYPTSDGYVAIITNNDQHWNWLVQALDATALATDPRFATVKGRCDYMDEVDAAIGAITARYAKTDLFELLIRNRVPCAPVRTVTEVIQDPHLHARGSLRWIDHPEYGRIVVPTSPLRFVHEERCRTARARHWARTPRRFSRSGCTSMPLLSLASARTQSSDRCALRRQSRRPARTRSSSA
jgi:crotonobetainyl-CoA:carnitine CoA-transferase CaiB-like acyl-CoA transferase